MISCKFEHKIIYLVIYETMTRPYKCDRVGQCETGGTSYKCGHSIPHAFSTTVTKYDHGLGNDHNIQSLDLLYSPKIAIHHIQLVYHFLKTNSSK